MTITNPKKINIKVLLKATKKFKEFYANSNSEQEKTATIKAFEF